MLWKCLGDKDLLPVLCWLAVSSCVLKVSVYCSVVNRQKLVATFDPRLALHAPSPLMYLPQDHLMLISHLCSPHRCST